MAENVKRIILQVIWDGKDLTKGVKESTKWLDSFRKRVLNISRGLRGLQMQLLGVGFFFMMLSRQFRTFFQEGGEFVQISLRMAEVVDKDLADSIIALNLTWEELKYELLDLISGPLTDMFNNIRNKLIPAIEDFLNIPMVKKITAWIVAHGDLVGTFTMVGVGLGALAQVIIFFATNPAGAIAIVIGAIIGLAIAWEENLGNIKGHWINFAGEFERWAGHIKLNIIELIGRLKLFFGVLINWGNFQKAWKGLSILEQALIKDSKAVHDLFDKMMDLKIVSETLAAGAKLVNERLYPQISGIGGTFKTVAGYATKIMPSPKDYITGGASTTVSIGNVNINVPNDVEVFGVNIAQAFIEGIKNKLSELVPVDQKSYGSLTHQ